jgi:hypothetical protein
MSSTNNKNYLENYYLEQIALKKQAEYHLFKNSPNGEAFTTYLPGNGILPARIAPSPFTDFSCDIESFLYGIGSTNLVPERTNIYNNLNMETESNKIKNVKSLNIYQKSMSGLSCVKLNGEPNIIYSEKIHVASPIIMDENPRPLIK